MTFEEFRAPPAAARTTASPCSATGTGSRAASTRATS